MKARENPFAPGRMERVLPFDPELVGTTWQEIESRWESLGRRACVVGHHGAGKTTFLDGFERRLCGRVPVVRLFFNRSKRRLEPEDLEKLGDLGGKCLLVDGDRHLPLRDRIELWHGARKASGVVSARHRAGRLPVLLGLRSNPQLAESLLGRACPKEAAEFRELLPALLRRHRGNIRNVWLECYDRWAG
ncbi:hypothetical protein HAHE_21820 [Haloferula helveola]|uniref:ATP-binding protein n=1 Tax=Haloferula helveola TaxID=490095 RepID=A0ABM7RA99_9BACT|nr:hypothetical protein HAHE_21820 [Haloferula helveola]